MIGKNMSVDFRNILGNEHAKRALEIASSGRHSILIYGCIGSGKTLLAQSLESITVKKAPWEDKEIKLHIFENRLPSISKLSSNNNKDQYVITLRTCMCNRQNRTCGCSTTIVKKMYEKIRNTVNFIDIAIPVYPEPFWKVNYNNPEDSATVYQRIEKCVSFYERSRFRSFPGYLNVNDFNFLKKRMNSKVLEILDVWDKKENVGMNNIIRASKIAFTIACMEGSDIITAPHIAEAITYRVIKFD